MPIYWYEIQSAPDIYNIFSERGITETAFNIAFDSLLDDEIGLIQHPPMEIGDIISPDSEDEKIRYFQCLLLSNTPLSLLSVSKGLGIQESYALFLSVLFGNTQFLDNLKAETHDEEAYLDKLNTLPLEDISQFSAYSILRILNDLVDLSRYASANDRLSSMITNNHVMNIVVREAIRKNNFTLLDRILAAHPDVFEKLDHPPTSLLGLIEYPRYSSYLTTIFNKTQGSPTSIDPSEHELFAKFIDFKYSSLTPVFSAVAEKRPIDSMDKDELHCCFYMIKWLIYSNTPADSEKIRQLLSIPQVKEMAHKKIGTGAENGLLEASRKVGNTIITELLLEIPAVYRKDKMLSLKSTIDPLAQEEAEARYIGSESAQAANNPAEQSKLQKLLSNYPITTHGLHHPAQELISQLEKRYASSPAVITGDDGRTIELPLQWTAFTDLKLSPADTAKALTSYYRNINHTAWRFLHSINPWMIEESDQQTHSDRYKNTIGQLWLAANDSTHPPLDGMTLEARVDEFIARIADMGRSNNTKDNIGDYPVCEQGMLGQLVLAVTSHPLYRIISMADISARFNEYLKDTFASKITNENRAIIHEIYQKLKDADALTTEEIAAVKALDLSKEELSPLIEQIKLVYGEEYASSAAFHSFLEKQLSLDGIYSSQLEKYSSVLHLDQILSSPTVQTQVPLEDTAEAIGGMKAVLTRLRVDEHTVPDEMADASKIPK